MLWLWDGTVACPVWLFLLSLCFSRLLLLAPLVRLRHFDAAVQLIRALNHDAVVPALAVVLSSVQPAC